MKSCLPVSLEKRPKCWSDPYFWICEFRKKNHFKHFCRSDSYFWINGFRKKNYFNICVFAKLTDQHNFISKTLHWLCLMFSTPMISEETKNRWNNKATVRSTAFISDYFDYLDLYQWQTDVTVTYHQYIYVK